MFDNLYGQLGSYLNKHEKFLVLCFKGSQDKNNMPLPRILYAISFGLAASFSFIFTLKMLLYKVCRKFAKKARDYVKKDNEYYIKEHEKDQFASVIVCKSLHLISNFFDVIYHSSKVSFKLFEMGSIIVKLIYETPISIALTNLIKLHDVITETNTVTEYNR